MRVIVLLGGVVLTLLLGCTASEAVDQSISASGVAVPKEDQNTPKAATVGQYSGFLTSNEYALMKPAKSASGQTVMRWVSPKLKQGEYHQIMMAPTEFFPEPAPGSKLSQTAMKDILHYFNHSLMLELYNVMPVIKNPSPQRLASKAQNTLKLRVAITATATKGKTNVQVASNAAIPIGFTTTADKKQPVILAAEYEVTDAATGEVMAVGMRQGIGKPLKSKTSQVTLENVKPILHTWTTDAAAFFASLSKK